MGIYKLIENISYQIAARQMREAICHKATAACSLDIFAFTKTIKLQKMQGEQKAGTNNTGAVIQPTTFAEATGCQSSH